MSTSAVPGASVPPPPAAFVPLPPAATVPAPPPASVPAKSLNNETTCSGGLLLDMSDAFVGKSKGPPARFLKRQLTRATRSASPASASTQQEAPATIGTTVTSISKSYQPPLPSLPPPPPPNCAPPATLSSKVHNVGATTVSPTPPTNMASSFSTPSPLSDSRGAPLPTSNSTTAVIQTCGGSTLESSAVGGYPPVSSYGALPAVVPVSAFVVPDNTATGESTGHPMEGATTTELSTQPESQPLVGEVAPPITSVQMSSIPGVLLSSTVVPVVDPRILYYNKQLQEVVVRPVKVPPASKGKRANATQAAKTQGVKWSNDYDFQPSPSAALHHTHPLSVHAASSTTARPHVQDHPANRWRGVYWKHVDVHRYVARRYFGTPPPTE